MTDALARGARMGPLFLDGLVHGAVVALAVWTLWYQAALVLQLDLRPAAWPTLVLLAGLAVGGGVLAVRAQAEPTDRRTGTAGPVASGSRLAPGRRVWWIGTGMAAVLALTVVVRGRLGVLPVAVAMAATVGFLLLVRLVSGRQVDTRADRSPGGGPDEEGHQPLGPVAHLAAVGVAVAAAGVSLFVLKSDEDDAYYVNRATWVAQHGSPALRDTMHGAEVLPQSIGIGLPTAGIESLHGVVAAALGVEAPTVAYLLAAPLAAASMVWATWLLVRVWAPRRPALVLVVAMLFVVASGASIVGAYSLTRMWQGKVVAYAVLLPLVWYYLTRLAAAGGDRTRVRLWTGMLLVSGVAFVGLTSSSALIAPVVTGAALLAAVLLRSRPLAVGACAFILGPLVNGVVQALGAPTIGGQVNAVTTSEQIFGIAFSPSTPMAVLAVLALVVGVAVAPLRAAVLLAAAVVAVAAVFLPGVVGLVDAVTGAGPVVWRLAIAFPLWVPVGMLAAVPVPRRRAPAAGRTPSPSLLRGPAVAALLVAVAVPALTGRWLWSSDVGAEVTARPSWKVPAAALADVRAARGLEVPRGPWLLPPNQMEVLAISTTGPYAVVPRAYYLPTLAVPAQDRADRQTLLDLVSLQGTSVPGAPEVRAALGRLDVALACVRTDRPRSVRVLGRAVGADLRAVGTMSCHVRRGG
ncbi:DUF6077 domain-containing protein [Nocardioides litoris]|uniref:DUF6077 domain-containing protein n=1 Tax=Nocardioides litoris TaxID=1926648 RepID=UPI00111CDD4B|nr:DUF6077 domain-containing protein [Nocardioides litoris]